MAGRMKEFEVGDVVRLRVGGLQMVVTMVTKMPDSTFMIGCAPMREADHRLAMRSTAARELVLAN